MPKFKQAFRLAGKPSERMILIALCKKMKAEFFYNEITGIAIVTAENQDEIQDITKAYNAFIGIAYKKLAIAQVQPKLVDVQIRTLTSEFMQAFAAMAYSIITGEPFMFKAETEAQRAGLKAGGSVG